MLFGAFNVSSLVPVSQLYVGTCHYDNMLPQLDFHTARCRWTRNWQALLRAQRRTPPHAYTYTYTRTHAHKHPHRLCGISPSQLYKYTRYCIFLSTPVHICALLNKGGPRDKSILMSFNKYCLQGGEPNHWGPWGTLGGSWVNLKRQ